MRYHEATKHTPASVRSTYHRLDWPNRPHPFKVYPDLPPLPLPSPAPDTGFPATSAMAGTFGEHRRLDAAELARLLALGAGINKVLRLPTGERHYFRTYACAGALYPIEVYVACAGVDGVDSGLYHYSPLESALRQLRPGDLRPWLMRATGGWDTTGRAPVSVILTGIPWRTAWKYRQRGYRHLFWDSGMIVANLLALSVSGGHRSEVVLGFDDGELNLLAGVDGRKELAICIVPIGFDEEGEAAATAAAPAEPISHASARLSFSEKDYDEIASAHRETSIAGIDQAQLWHRERFSVKQPVPGMLSRTGLEQTIRRRGSKRAFDPGFEVPIEELAGILDHATYRLECDWGPQISQAGLLAFNVHGLEPGAYARVDGFDAQLYGDLREKGRFLCLEQALGGEGAATIFLMADLDQAFSLLGNRGYRAAQLDAGITAGRIYLGAYACGLGATGLTFYDDEVRGFFHTEAHPMLVVAIGH